MSVVGLFLDLCRESLLFRLLSDQMTKLSLVVDSITENMQFIWARPIEKCFTFLSRG